MVVVVNNISKVQKVIALVVIGSNIRTGGSSNNRRCSIHGGSSSKSRQY